VTAGSPQDTAASHGETALRSLPGIVSEVLDLPPAEVTDETGPASCSQWSSLRHLQLVLVLEAQYGVSFTSTEIRSMVNVARIRETLRAKGVMA
jgi:acyl carrier protein